MQGLDFMQIHLDMPTTQLRLWGEYLQKQESQI